MYSRLLPTSVLIPRFPIGVAFCCSCRCVQLPLNFRHRELQAFIYQGLFFLSISVIEPSLSKAFLNQ